MGGIFRSKLLMKITNADCWNWNWKVLQPRLTCGPVCQGSPSLPPSACSQWPSCSSSSRYQPESVSQSVTSHSFPFCDDTVKLPSDPARQQPYTKINKYRKGRSQKRKQKTRSLSPISLCSCRHTTNLHNNLNSAFKR